MSKLKKESGLTVYPIKNDNMVSDGSKEPRFIHTQEVLWSTLGITGKGRWDSQDYLGKLEGGQTTKFTKVLNEELGKFIPFGESYYSRFPEYELAKGKAPDIVGHIRAYSNNIDSESKIVGGFTTSTYLFENILEMNHFLGKVTNNAILVNEDPASSTSDSTGYALAFNVDPKSLKAKDIRGLIDKSMIPEALNDIRQYRIVVEMERVNAAQAEYKEAQRVFKKTIGTFDSLIIANNGSIRREKNEGETMLDEIRKLGKRTGRSLNKAEEQ